MNRTLVFGITLFLAVVGLALLNSGNSSVEAGHCGGGCHGIGHGCHGGLLRGHGCHGVRLFHRHGCHGVSHGCHGVSHAHHGCGHQGCGHQACCAPAAPACEAPACGAPCGDAGAAPVIHGGAPVPTVDGGKVAPPPPPVDPKPASPGDGKAGDGKKATPTTRAPLGFRSVSFAR